MVFGAQKFKQYLLWKTSHFFVDHWALINIINKVLVQRRLMRQILFLQEYDFKVFHKLGEKHLGADELVDVELFHIDQFEDEDPEWFDLKYLKV